MELRPMKGKEKKGRRLTAKWQNEGTVDPAEEREGWGRDLGKRREGEESKTIKKVQRPRRKESQWKF